MTPELTSRPPLLASRAASTVVLWLTARRAARSSAIWGYLFGAAIASSAISYTRIYRTPAERNALAAAYGSNKATSALFGPAPQLQTVAGFTVFKISMTLMTLGAVWGLLTSTRLLRGEEEARRWDLLLAGETTRRHAAAQALWGLASGALVLWTVTAAITVVIGIDSDVHIGAGPALFFATAMVATAIVFLAVGALTSRLASTRRQAAAYAAGFLAVSYALRMIADAGVGLHGLIWTSPLGWVEELRPLTRPNALAPADRGSHCNARSCHGAPRGQQGRQRRHHRRPGQRAAPSPLAVGAPHTRDAAVASGSHRMVGRDGHCGLALRARGPIGRIDDRGILGAGRLRQARRQGDGRRRRSRRVLSDRSCPGGIRRGGAGRGSPLGRIERAVRPSPRAAGDPLVMAGRAIPGGRARHRRGRAGGGIRGLGRSNQPARSSGPGNAP